MAVSVVATLVVVMSVSGGDSRISRPTDHISAVADEVPYPLITDPFAGDYAVTRSSPASLVVNDGSATVQGLTPGRSLTVSLPSLALADVQVSHDLVLPAIRSGATALYESTQMRRQPDGDYYAATAVVRADGSIILKAERVSGGVQTTISRTPLAATVSTGQALHIESRIAGSHPVTLLARAWTTGNAIPDWQLVATDSTAGAIAQAGSVGLRGYLSRRGKAASFKVSKWRVSTVDSSATSTSTTSSTSTSSRSATATGDGATTSSSVTTTSGESSPVAPVTSSSADAPSSSAPSSSAPSSSAPSSSVPSSSASSSSASPSPSPSAPSPSSGTVSSAGFVHPGIVDSSAQLAQVASNIQAGRQPSLSAYLKAKNSRYGQLSWQPHPWTWVGCGAYSSPDEGCTQETDDAQAAYTDALVWSYSGDHDYADKALQILDAWSGTLQGHKLDSTYSNGRLQAAWAAETFTKAAEIMRYSDAGWSSANIARFENMLNTAFLPLVNVQSKGGGPNWKLSMDEATINIGVFTDNRAVFDAGVADWRKQVPAAIYLTSDGPTPVLPAGSPITSSSLNRYWYSPTRYVDGLEGEDCRDLNHVTFGFAAALSAAETASIQGVDLYGEQKARLITGMEYTTRYLNDPQAPGWVCAQPPVLGGAGTTASWEIGYNHYATLGGASMPQTRQWILAHRPTPTALHMNWETLTHGAPIAS